MGTAGGRCVCVSMCVHVCVCVCVCNRIHEMCLYLMLNPVIRSGLLFYDIFIQCCIMGILQQERRYLLQTDETHAQALCVFVYLVITPCAGNKTASSTMLRVNQSRPGQAGQTQRRLHVQAKRSVFPPRSTFYFHFDYGSVITYTRL